MYYFASDIHLGAGDKQYARRTEQRFLRWLDMAGKDADTIFLVGDIFDFWFEYGHVVPKGFTRIFGKLAELTDRGVNIVFFTGNHYMWCSDYLKEECGLEIHYTPQTYTLAGKTIFIAHGDNMNIAGKPMLRLMNTCFRSKFLRVIFSWLVHPDLAMRFGKWWSGKSRKSHPKPTTVDTLEFLIDYAHEYKKSNPATDAIIFGHLHLGHDIKEENLQILFLSDWSGEDISYAVIDNSGELNLKTFR